MPKSVRIKEIGQRLAKALVDYQGHPVKLAEKTGLAPATADRCLKGGVPKAGDLAFICERLKVSPAYLLLGHEFEGDVLTDEELKIMELWRRLADADQAAFLQILDRMAHKEEIIQSLGGPAPPKAAIAGGG
ncbi:hypothetical protein LCGC14_1077100 [marine sediment metagenome]|uniref:Uncharacterized protein n=1 Tax=marine sediment metagenome TaxID=412755 RepID=A0A0F9MLA3_9ZZZZ